MAKNRALIVASGPGGTGAWKICNPERNRRRHDGAAKADTDHVDQAVRGTGKKGPHTACRRNRMRRGTFRTFTRSATKDCGRTRRARLHYFFGRNVTRDGPSVPAEQK